MVPGLARWSHPRGARTCRRTSQESFILADDDTVASVTAGFREAVAESERIAASYALDDIAHHNRRSPLSLRWIYVHMVEELARHAGHADILREQILAADRLTRARPPRRRVRVPEQPRERG